MYGPDELMKKLGGSVSTMTALVESLGGSNSAAATAISGFTSKAPKGSAELKAYNAALRNVQRYIASESAAAGLPAAKQQRGGVRGLSKMKAIRQAKANKLKKKNLQASAPGEIWISSQLLQRDVRTFGISAGVPQADVDQMLTEFVEGRAEEAWSAFSLGLLDGYGLPNGRYNDALEIDDLYLLWT